ncbi:MULTISPECIES: hypothetical protein [unclassified Psychrobacillus]|uniref:hypothetical protein n=1 Tax=unclassified Psychrobacillus TaxID=2636677 RepID=UPI0030F80096
MSQQTLQGRMNAQKEKFLQLLKQEGKYIEHCPKQGFIYEIIGPVFDQMYRLAIALNNGKLEVLKMEEIN